MPAGDGTGPLGMGPVSGWGMGYCAGYAAPGWVGPGPGRPFYGRGYYHHGGWWAGPGFAGGGRGWRHWYYATGLPRWARWGVPPAGAFGAPPAGPSREQEIETLKDEAQWLQDQLEAINKRMDELSQE
jgi:Family of unknown function (DUF5320)